MLKSMRSAALAAVLGLAATAATAEPTAVSGSSLQNVINSLYQSSSCTGCSPTSAAPNVITDQHLPDEVWRIEASGGAVATVVIELGGFASTNTFGVYDINDPTKQVQLFGGAATTGSRAVLSIMDDGMVQLGFMDTGVVFSSSNFGFYLNSGAQSGGGLLYSESARNANGNDHMVAYQGDGDLIKIGRIAAGPWGSSSYILAWEDLVGLGDRDYDDFVVYVESIAIPEPGTLALLGLGLAGLGIARRRRRA